MANVVMILGSTGKGKSTSLKTLDPKETVVFNVLKKRLPFKGSGKLYNAEAKNLFNLDDYGQIIAYLKAINEKATYVKNIIIDDCIYLMRKEYFKTAKVTGYSKYTDIAAHFQGLIQEAENCREDMNIYIILHSEEVTSDGSIVTYKASTIGKLIDNAYNPMEVVPVVLFADIQYDESKNPIYGFYTHRCMNGNIEIPAKSPEGMFEDNFIPNDLAYVNEKMNEYYN